MLRQIVRIDEEKCDGCGLCVPECHEGAIQIVEGKARLVADRYCDGLGACLGHCPRGAITIEEREALDFDPAAVARLLAGQRRAAAPGEQVAAAAGEQVAAAAGEHIVAAAGQGRLEEQVPGPQKVAGSCPSTRAAAADAQPHSPGGHSGCPGSRLRQFERRGEAHDGPSGSTPTPTPTPTDASAAAPATSELTHWPVQLRLLPPQAPILRGASLLVTADCVPVALADFHSRLLRGRAVLMGCPKFDPLGEYVARLAEIMALNGLVEVVVARMEVPCCAGITQAVVEARRRAGVATPVREVIVGVDGAIRATRELAVEAVA